MPIVTYQVSAGVNDGRVGSTFSSTSTTLTIGKASGWSYRLWFRFTGVNIPQGATIVSAKLQLYANGSFTGSAPITRLYLNDSDSATSPTSEATYNGAALTTHYADWTMPNFTAGTWYDSPDIAAAVQDVINRSGWASGNALMVLHKDNGSIDGYYRTCTPYEADTTKAAKLVIEYTEGSPSSNVTVTAATASASAEALAATPHANVLVVGGTATASAEALPATPTTALIVLGAVASAVAEALPATPHADVVVQASVAEASAEALPATAVYNVHVTVLAVTATASAEALPAEPIAQRNITVEAATGTATAEALAAVARSGKKLYYIIRYR